MRSFVFFLAFAGYAAFANAQQPVRKLPATRTTAVIKIDGDLSDMAWKEAIPASDFIENRPSFGRKEEEAIKTVMYILYDNTSVYVAGYCHERKMDSISKELIGRDKIGTNDFAGVILDTYNDKINAVGFYLTPYGEQFDIKYSPTNEDIVWSAVWDGAAKTYADGWSFEMRIPYSALRFVSRENQTWGINFIRQRRKTGQQITWSPVDPNKNGFINQEGEWTGISKIESPVRLSFSPYLSGTVNHFPNKKLGYKEKDWTTAVNGGMDVKYGISESFTLDMTLVPDFGQVRSDNKVLNLGPFEQRYQEQRPFFTEGTELFNKGNLFYSRHIGEQPLHYWDADYLARSTGRAIVENPNASKLINAIKVSGRTKKGLGIGVFNAVTKEMHALIEDNQKNQEKYITSPLTNYNIVVLDQTLKNNSSVSFINTNVMRNGSDRDGNVSAGLFDFNNKKNTYNWSGKFSVSQINSPELNHVTGYSHNIGFGKTGGRWNFQVGQELVDDKYDINDLGAMYNNNYLDHFLWSGYKWNKPKNWHNDIRLNFNAYYSRMFKKFPNQLTDSRFQALSLNVNANARLKNLWSVGVFVGYQPQGHDFYETRQNAPIEHKNDAGTFFTTTERVQFQGWFNSNNAKKYSFGGNYFVGIRDQFNSFNHQIYLYHKYRFNDRLSLSHDFTLNPFSNDAGYYRKDSAGVINFSRRDRLTIENALTIKYNFSNRSGITMDLRHYWSRVEYKELYKLNKDGSLTAIGAVPVNRYSNFNIFNINAQYTWQFAPGSFVYIVYKDENDPSNVKFNSEDQYFKSFDRVISSPQSHTLSLKVVYYLDYLDFKKWKKKDK